MCVCVGRQLHCDLGLFGSRTLGGLCPQTDVEGRPNAARPKVPWLAAPSALGAVLATGVQKSLNSLDQTVPVELQVHQSGRHHLLCGCSRTPALDREERLRFFG